MVKINNVGRLSLAEVQKHLAYDRETGYLTWFKRTGGHMAVGYRAGHIAPNGYRRITLVGRRYMAHRLVWLFETGEWPEQWVDHISGDKDDNRVSNLRLATTAENNANSSILAKANKSGFRGVCFRKDRNTYIAYIYVNGKIKLLGSFKDAVRAARAAADARKKQWGEFATASISPLPNRVAA